MSRYSTVFGTPEPKSELGPYQSGTPLPTQPGRGMVNPPLAAPMRNTGKYGTTIGNAQPAAAPVAAPNTPIISSAVPVPVQAAGAAASVDPAKAPPPPNIAAGVLQTGIGAVGLLGAGVTDAAKNAFASATGRVRPDSTADIAASADFMRQGLDTLHQGVVQPVKDAGAAIADAAGWEKAPTAPPAAPAKPTAASAPQGTAFTGTAGRGTVNPPMANAPAPAPAPATAAPDALPAAGAPSPTGPSAGTITIGGKTIQIPATGDLPAIPKVGASPGFIPGAAGGYAGGPIGGAPAGPVDSNGNGTTRTAELRAQLETQRADQAHDNDMNQTSLAANQATAKENDAKREKWEQEVAESSILNRPSVSGTPAQMQAQVAMAQLQQQGRTARMQNQGMIRGQDIQARGQDVSAKTAEKGLEVQKRGQDVNAGVQTRGQDVQVQTTGMNNAVQTQNAALTAATQTGIAAGNNATAAANTKATIEGHLKVAELQARANAGHIQNLHVDPLTHMATYSIGNKMFSEPVPLGALEPKKAK